MSSSNKAITTINITSQSAPSAPTHTESLDTCIRSRHSIRSYKPDAVPESLLYSCLSLARLAPSNSNIQNWRLSIATGAARDRIVSVLSSAAAKHGPEGIAPLPEQFKHYRSEMGHGLYGEHGYNLPRGDKAGLHQARMRNYTFFDAPVIAVIHMSSDLKDSAVDSMSVGMYIQTFMLALTEQGLGTCLMISVTGYPEVLKEGFGIGEDEVVLCGMAIGWPDDRAINHVVTERDQVEMSVNFLTE